MWRVLVLAQLAGCVVCDCVTPNIEVTLTGGTADTLLVEGPEGDVEAVVCAGASPCASFRVPVELDGTYQLEAELEGAVVGAVTHEVVSPRKVVGRCCSDVYLGSAVVDVTEPGA